MKFALPLVFISIVVAAWLHVSKKDSGDAENGNIDQLSVATKEMQRILPMHTSVYLKQYNVDFYLYCRYLLAPRHCSIDPDEKLDTIFSICKADAPDSILHKIMDNKVEIWSSKDNQYQYFLTCNR